MIQISVLLASLSFLVGVQEKKVEKVQTEFMVEVGAQGTQLTHSIGPKALVNKASAVTATADFASPTPRTTGGKSRKKSTGKKNQLRRVGAPKYVSAQPDFYSLKGIGCLEFDGHDDLYFQSRAFISNSRNFVLETWAYANVKTAKGLHAVVAHGDGARGFLVAQKDDQWVAFVGGMGAVAIGKVERQVWVHLALVYEQGKLSVYQNGKKTQQVNARWRGLSENFSIGGIAGSKKECFAGRIAVVRLSRFKSNQFNPAKDFLIDSKQLKKIQARLTKKQRELISQLVQISGTEQVKQLTNFKQTSDWLVHHVKSPVRILACPNENGLNATIRLTNGLVSRDFFVSENLATVNLRNLSNGAQYLRSIQPEARINLDGKWYDVGGLKGQKLKAYLMNDWLGNLHDDGTGFQFQKIEIGKPKKRYHWKPRFNSGQHAWPPRGKRLTMKYIAPKSAKAEHRNTEVHIHYEMYEGIPVLCKYFEFVNKTKKPIDVDQIETEIIALQQDQLKRIHLESDFSHALFNRETKASDTQHLTGAKINEYMSQGTTTRWRVESGYHFYATHNQHEDKLLDFPHHNVMVSTIPKGPDETVAAGKTFTSMHSFLMLYDNDDAERKSLSYLRIYRTIAPQVNENLLSAFISSTDPKVLEPYMDQAAELGIECLSLQFPSVHIAHDNIDPKYISRFKSIADYGKSKGIILGAYELVIASRNRGARNNVVHPITKRPGGFFGQSACVGSDWFKQYRKNSLQFLDQTGFGMWDIDGPYHGEPCASPDHPGHKGLDDSQWQQWKIFRDFLAELMARDQYLPIPEWNFLCGQSVTSMGYREAAAGLPANLQLLLYRQYIYDGTWYKTPTMGWIEFNLSKLRPFKNNVKEYERWLVQGLGSGTRINWRGPGHFYDTPETKKLVKGWFDWYRRHRKILTSDIVHLARPSGRDLDAIFHVNPSLKERGLVVVFNPLSVPVKKNLDLPLYYTGIEDSAEISVHTDSSDTGTKNTYKLSRDFRVQVPIEVPAQGHIWLLIEDAGKKTGDRQMKKSAQFIDKLNAGKSCTIATMGTSLTGGSSKWVTPFSAWLSEQYGDKAKVVNFGVGASASERYLRGQSGLDVVKKVARLKPDVVFIEFAVNDAYTPYKISLDDSKRNLNKIIDQILDANPSTEVILMTMNGAMDVPSKRVTGAKDRPRIAEYYQGYRDVARKRNLRVCDAWPHWQKLMKKNPSRFLEFVPDGLHPTQKAYQQVLMPILKETLRATNDGAK